VKLSELYKMVAIIEKNLPGDWNVFFLDLTCTRFLFCLGEIECFYLTNKGKDTWFLEEAGKGNDPKNLHIKTTYSIEKLLNNIEVLLIKRLNVLEKDYNLYKTALTLTSVKTYQAARYDIEPLIREDLE
jgi:hypothetical protein